MELRLTATLCLAGLLLTPTLQLQATNDVNDLTGPKTTIKQLIATYEKTKEGKVLATIEVLSTKESEQQTIREKNNNDTNIKKWYCGTGLGAAGLGIVAGTIIAIFHHINTSTTT